MSHLTWGFPIAPNQPVPPILEDKILDDEGVELIEGDVLRSTVDVDVAINHVAPPVIVPTLAHEKSPYGPWMMVDRRQSRSSCNAPTTVPASVDATVSGSRFNPIFEEEIPKQPQNSEPTIVDPVVSPIAQNPEPTTGTTKVRGKGKVSIDPRPLCKPLQVQRPTGFYLLKVPPKLARKGSSSSSNRPLVVSSRVSVTMNSAHTVVVSENVDPNVVNVVVTKGPHLSRRPEPPDHAIVDARLPQANTPVKILGNGHAANQLI
ncbi:hypothetical protein V6N11_021650 [Hibiscus sabdariffa]|uniref:Uncharacterized protein n=1 Tax=Hibiscus sabdariffa TaxID=183260 RepID=A0ABR2PBJ8_9ROSI